MKYPLEISTEPATQPLTLQEAKDFMREDRDVEDSLIQQFVGAARKNLENHTGYVLIDTVFKLYLEDFSDIKLPKKPIKSGSVSIEYVDTTGAKQTLTASKYNVHEVDSPVQIEFLSNLPDLDNDEKYPVIITFTAGYGAAESDIPDDWKSVIGLMTMILWNRDLPLQGDKVIDFNPLNYGVIRAQLQGYMIGRFK